jgi:hypothetical protein
MIFYALLTSAYFNFIFFDVIRFLIKEEKLITGKLIFFFAVYIFIIMIMITMIIFNIFHFWITISNYTTHEFVTDVVRKKEDGLSGVNKVSKQSIYDISSFENWKQVHGWNPFLWVLPVNFTYNSMWNNGLNFKLNRKYEYEVIKSV